MGTKNELVICVVVHLKYTWWQHSRWNTTKLKNRQIFKLQLIFEFKKNKAQTLYLCKHMTPNWAKFTKLHAFYPLRGFSVNGTLNQYYLCIAKLRHFLAIFVHIVDEELFLNVSFMLSIVKLTAVYPKETVFFDTNERTVSHPTWRPSVGTWCRVWV